MKISEMIPLSPEALKIRMNAADAVQYRIQPLVRAFDQVREGAVKALVLVAKVRRSRWVVW